jgi:hypothetical protein
MDLCGGAGIFYALIGREKYSFITTILTMEEKMFGFCYRLLVLSAAVIILFGCGNDDDNGGTTDSDTDTDTDTDSDTDSDTDTDSDSDTDTDSDSDSDADFEELHADIDRNMTPDATPDELEAMRVGNLDLSVNLLKSLIEEKDGNLAVSAFSFRAAFGMLLDRKSVV